MERASPSGCRGYPREPSLPDWVPKRMRGFFLSCAGLLFGLLSASGCSKEVKAEFPRPPATAALPPERESAPPPEPVSEVVVDSAPAPAPEPKPAVDEPEPDPPKPPPPPVAAEPEAETPPEPLSTQLAGGGDEEVDPEVVSKLEEAGTLLGSVGGRDLSQGQREQVAAARGFISQARRALDDGDERRALVLVDKGLILAQDVERTSRP